MIRAAVGPRLGSQPVVVLEPKALYRRLGAALPTDGSVDETALHAARRARAGSDLTLIAWGAAVPVAIDAAERMTADGFEVGVIDLRALVPLDVATLVEAVRETGRALVVSDGAGAFAGAVAAEVMREAFLSLEAPIGLVSSDDEDWVARVREAALATLEF